MHEMDPVILNELEMFLEYQIGQTNQELQELLEKESDPVGSSEL
jgi:hypothetical protein